MIRVQLSIGRCKGQKRPLSSPFFASVWLLAALLLASHTQALAIPPLTDQQQLRLETAHDGRDHREEAFIALVENVRQWSIPQNGQVEIGDVPVRLQPDVEALLDDPERFRGELFRLRGVLHQQAELYTDAGSVREWFLRTVDGRPIVVYVPIPNAAGESRVQRTATLRDGDEVVLFARFYKRMTFTARDGEQRDYPAFVGAWPQRLGAQSGGAGGEIALMLLPVVILLVVFLLLMAFIRRQKAPARSRSRPWTEEELVALDEAGPLPDDPAEALTELKRRAEQR